MRFSDHTKGLLLIFTAVLILSPDALLVRLIQCDLWTLLFWRCLLTGSMMVLFLGILQRRRFWQGFRAIGLAGLLSALVLCCGSLLFVGSIKQTAAANTLIILSATPVFSSLFSWIFLHEPIPLRTKLAILTCFGGILLIFSGSLNSGLLLGDLLALGATSMWAGNLVILRHARGVNMVPANVLGNFLVLPIALFFGAQPLAVAGTDFQLLLLLGGLILPLAFTMITFGPHFLPAPEVSLILLTETILGPIWVWLAIAEVPRPATFFAGGLILGTLIVHTLLALRNQPRRVPLADAIRPGA